MSKNPKPNKKPSRPTSGIRLSDTQVNGLNKLSERTGLRVAWLKQIAINWFIEEAEANGAINIKLNSLKNAGDKPSPDEDAGRSDASNSGQ